MVTDPRRAALFACVCTTATAATFFLTGVVALPLPLYLPLTRQWVLASANDAPGPLGSLAMDFFGRSLLALTAGGFALAVVGLLTRKRERSKDRTDAPTGPSENQLRLALAYAVTAVLLCAALFAYKLAGREITPVDLSPAVGGGEEAVENASDLPP